MRNTFYFLLSLFIFFPAALFSQTDAELKKHLDKVNELMKAQNYTEAYNELEKAKTETQKLVTTQLEKAFPATVEKWTLQKDQPGMMPYNMPGGARISVTKTYEKAKEEANKPTGQDSMQRMAAMYMQPRVTITVSNDTFPARSILMTHTNPPAANAGMNAGMPGEEVKAIEIKSMKAVSRLNASMKMTSISILTGNAVVQMYGMQVETLEPLMKIAEALDLKKIEEVFGKK